MLRLPPFEYLRPRTVPEAAEMLAAHDGLAMVIAGGSDLLPKMKRRQIEPTHLVGLRGLPELAGISAEPDGSLRIGAAETLAAICTAPEVERSAPALATAARSVSTPQLRAPERSAATSWSTPGARTTTRPTNGAAPWASASRRTATGARWPPAGSAAGPSHPPTPSRC